MRTLSDGEKGELGLAAKVRVGRERKEVRRRVSTTLLCVKKSLWNMEKRPESMCSVYENMGVGGRRKWGYGIAYFKELFAWSESSCNNTFSSSVPLSMVSNLACKPACFSLCSIFL